MTTMGPWEPPPGGRGEPAQSPPPPVFGPPAPPPQLPVYPPIPGTAPSPGRAQPTRTVVLALVSALIGGLLASGATVLALRQMGGTTAVAAAGQQQISSPIIPASRERTQVEAVAEAVLPTVVQIDVGGEGLAARGNGSGVIYRSDGHILTNNHVVSTADELSVVFSDGRRARATVVGRDELSDIAVVKVERQGLTAISTGESEALRVGQLAVAIGSPFGLEGSVTAGVISALNRPISVGDGIRLPSVIQTDAPINPGNSGGALVGADGRLIGVNSAILTSGAPANAGVGFAIPVDIAVDIANELIASGEVTYPFLGVEGSDVTAEAADRLGVEQGAFVERVQNGTPAARAGLRRGDVIVALDGEPITTMDDLILGIRRSEVGDVVEVEYLRDERERRTEITLVERPED